MADISRIEELRRRVQRDPASIAFAQLAEEYRRAGRYEEAIETCEQGLAHHPGYLSARVTLGRSYLETNDLAAAEVELQQVLRAAPENLAALRGMAEIHHRRGELQKALAHYRTALEFARNDPELQHLAEQIAKELEPQPAAPAVVDGMSFEDVRNAFLNLSLPEGQAHDGTEPHADPAGEAASVTTIDLPAVAADEPFPWPVHEEPAPPLQDVPLPSVHEEPVSFESSAPAILEAPAFAADGSIALEGAPAADVALAVDAASALDVSRALVDIDLTPSAIHAEPALPPLEPGASVAPDASTAPLDDEPAPADAEAVTGEQADASTQVDALERWLETIIKDRQRRV